MDKMIDFGDFIIPIIIGIFFLASYVFREVLQPISDITDKPHVEYEHDNACVYIRWYVRNSDIPSYAFTKWKYYNKFNFVYLDSKWISADIKKTYIIIFASVFSALMIGCLFIDISMILTVIVLGVGVFGTVTHSTWYAYRILMSDQRRINNEISEKKE